MVGSHRPSTSYQMHVHMHTHQGALTPNGQSWLPVWPVHMLVMRPQWQPALQSAEKATAEDMAVMHSQRHRAEDKHASGIAKGYGQDACVSRTH